MALFGRKKRKSSQQFSNNNASVEAGRVKADVTDGVTVRDALSLFYYLMSADGTLNDDELEKFDAMFQELGGSNYVSESVLVHQCQTKLDENASPSSSFISVISCVDQVLYEPTYIDSYEELISPRLLVWDLLSIAYCDGYCHDTERELVSHIAKMVGVEEELVLEMESFVLTLLDLTHEEEWIKTTRQPYVVVESVLNDIETRKSAVFDGVGALIAL